MWPGGVHVEAAVLDLHRTVLREVGKATAGGQAKRIPVASWRLHADLSLEGMQGRGDVEDPVAPGGASEPAR